MFSDLNQVHIVDSQQGHVSYKEANSKSDTRQGWIQDFKLGGGAHLK